MAADLPVPLSQAALDLIQQAENHANQGLVGLHHYLLALLEAYGPMAADMASGLDPVSYRQQLEARVAAGDAGETLDPAAIRDEIGAHALKQGKSRAYERDVAAVLLQKASWTILAPSRASSSSSPPASRDPEGQALQDTSVEAANYRPRAMRSTPTLEKLGRDLCRDGLAGRLAAIVERDREIQAVIETLCRRTKRNPALVGPPGVGKTAIVEGLAQRIVRGDVPKPLQGVRLFELRPSTLVSSAGSLQDFITTVDGLVNEASQDGIVLFIDEMHSMVGAGGARGTDDVAGLLKPALGRGDIACIAATTEDEYRRFIEPDAALERRFQPIRVDELSRRATQVVLEGLLPVLENSSGIPIGRDVVGGVIELSDRFLKNRNFPDKAIDVLEQSVAAAASQGRSCVEQDIVEEVVERMAGVPTDWDERLQSLGERLEPRLSLDPNDIEALVGRLQVTMRGLDIRPQRPNAVILVANNPDLADELAAALAEDLFDSPERLVAIDLGPFSHPADISRLVGAAPGYVGYGQSLPLHRVAAMPWCVLLLGNVDRCDPQVRDVVAQSLRDGTIVDGGGKPIHLSDTIVILTAALPESVPARLGLRTSRPGLTPPVRPSLADLLGESLSSGIDLVIRSGRSEPQNTAEWLQRDLLPQLSQRYRSHGVVLRWDQSLVDWLLSQRADCETVAAWERLLEDRVLAQLLPLLTASRGKSRSDPVLLVGWSAGRISASCIDGDGG